MFSWTVCGNVFVFDMSSSTILSLLTSFNINLVSISATIAIWIYNNINIIDKSSRNVRRKVSLKIGCFVTSLIRAGKSVSQCI